jgi:SsrA-binding protein
MQKNSAQIASNKKAWHDYHLEKPIEAGLSLFGWEVKAIRNGRVQLKDSYCLIRYNEIWLLNAHISPLSTTAAYLNPDPVRTRKCLLHKKQINKLIGAVQQKGLTLVPLSLYWANGKIKLSIALAQGKKKHDKRQTEKEKDWQREKDKIQKMSKRTY